MPNPRYLSGRRAEYKTKAILQDEGWLVVRSAGSKGFWDLWAIHPAHPFTLLIQVKSVKDGKAIPRLEAAFRASLPLPTGPMHYAQQLWVWWRGKAQITTT